MKTLSIHLISTLIGAIAFLFSSFASAQVDRTSDLYAQLQARDSLLFSVGFNQCDMTQFEALLDTDFEFYHDQGGITSSKEDFISSFRTNMCPGGKNVTQRRLDRKSLEVYPLHENAQLYGAIQSGIHYFQTTEAKFTHLWIMTDRGWKIRRILSYDHHQAK